MCRCFTELSAVNTPDSVILVIGEMQHCLHDHISVSPNNTKTPTLLLFAFSAHALDFFRYFPPFPRRSCCERILGRMSGSARSGFRFLTSFLFRVFFWRSEQNNLPKCLLDGHIPVKRIPGKLKSKLQATGDLKSEEQTHRITEAVDMNPR
jgi:hypothetical protein